MSSKSYEYLVPICVFGEASVGKSSIILRFREGSFDEGTANPTIGVEFSDKVINIDGTNIKIQMWDTTGDPRSRSVTKQFFKNKAACLLVFDLASKPTFDRLPVWIHDLKDLTHPQAKIILVGNKADLEAQRKVSKEQAEAFAAEHELTYFETSCKTGQNIEACFTHLATKMLEWTMSPEFNKLNMHLLGIRQREGPSPSEFYTRLHSSMVSQPNVKK